MRIAASLLSPQQQQHIKEGLQSRLVIPSHQSHVFSLVEQPADDVDAGERKNGLFLLQHLEIAQSGPVYTL